MIPETPGMRAFLSKVCVNLRDAKKEMRSQFAAVETRVSDLRTDAVNAYAATVKADEKHIADLAGLEAKIGEMDARLTQKLTKESFILTQFAKGMAAANARIGVLEASLSAQEASKEPAVQEPAVQEMVPNALLEQLRGDLNVVLADMAGLKTDLAQYRDHKVAEGKKKGRSLSAQNAHFSNRF